MDRRGNATLYTVPNSGGVSFAFVYTNLRTVNSVASNLYGASFAHVLNDGRAGNNTAGTSGGVSFAFVYTNLRTVNSVASNLYGASFASLYSHGRPTNHNAPTSLGVRPVFGFKVLKNKVIRFLNAENSDILFM